MRPVPHEHPWLRPAPTEGGSTWRVLAEAVASGEVLLHGARTAGLTALVPRTPQDHSRDEYSKQTAVYATEDPTWALAYGVRDPSCAGFLNACLHRHQPDGSLGPREIFLSYGRSGDHAPPLSPGVVYLLPREPFIRMSSYEDELLGWITECQWAATGAVTILDEVTLHPEDLPLTPHLHDPAQVAERSRQDPLGFPWWG